LPRHSELIRILAFVSRILAVITNVFVRLVGRVMLIWRSFPLVLGLRYFFCSCGIRGIRRLDSFFSILFFKAFIIFLIIWFYGIFGRQLYARYLIFS
jgi:hypothetical protein